MGSYGNIVMECSWCRALEQCSTGLLDVDGVGVICEPCYRRGYPPHFYYLSRLLNVEWPIATIIARYTFAACAKTEGYRSRGPVCSPTMDSAFGFDGKDWHPVDICLAPAGSADADGQPSGKNARQQNPRQQNPDGQARRVAMLDKEVQTAESPMLEESEHACYRSIASFCLLSARMQREVLTRKKTMILNEMGALVYSNTASTKDFTNMTDPLLDDNCTVEAAAAFLNPSNADHSKVMISTAMVRHICVRISIGLFEKVAVRLPYRVTKGTCVTSWKILWIHMFSSRNRRQWSKYIKNLGIPESAIRLAGVPGKEAAACLVLGGLIYEGTLPPHSLVNVRPKIPNAVHTLVWPRAAADDDPGTNDPTTSLAPAGSDGGQGRYPADLPTKTGKEDCIGLAPGSNKADAWNVTTMGPWRNDTLTITKILNAKSLFDRITVNDMSEVTSDTRSTSATQHGFFSTWAPTSNSLSSSQKASWAG